MGDVGGEDFADDVDGRALRVMSWVMAMLMWGVAGGAPAGGAAGTALA